MQRACRPAACTPDFSSLPCVLQLLAVQFSEASSAVRPCGAFGANLAKELAVMHVCRGGCGLVRGPLQGHRLWQQRLCSQAFLVGMRGCMSSSVPCCGGAVGNVPRPRG